MRLAMRLYDEPVARFDSEADPVGWVRMWPSSVGEGWSRVSARSWEPERHDPAIGEWLRGLLPEGFSAETFEREAAARIASRDGALRDTVLSLLWANSAHDYSGAISFDGVEAAGGPGSYRSLSEDEIGAALRVNRVQGRNGVGAERPGPWSGRKSALTGMRGKVSATLREDGSWWAAEGGARNTWIIKGEDRPMLPGEAGVEAVLQRALGLVGVPAAVTRSRVLGGVQCVLSERADRYVECDVVRVRHQEDFLQATGLPAGAKYDDAAVRGGSWADLYRILGNHAVRPLEEADRLTRFLAANVFAGNADLHRRNVGLSHSLPGEPFSVRLAPVYDFGAWPGLEQVERGSLPEPAPARLVIPVGGEVGFERVDREAWARHAGEAGLDPGHTVELVRRVGRELPDAIAASRVRARFEDENREQWWVDRRLDEVVAFCSARSVALK